MKQILTVFAFTYRDAVRKKAFIVSTVIILAAIAVLCAIPGISSAFKKDKTASENTQQSGETADTQTKEKSKVCYYLDEEGLIPAGLDVLREAFPDWTVKESGAEEEAGLREQIRESEDIALVKITKDGELPFITVVNKNFMSGIAEKTVWEALSNVYIHSTLLAQGISEETIDFAQSTLPGTVETEGSMNLSGYIIGIALVMMTFFAVYYYGYGVSMSVATEKTTRVMETLVGSAKPSRILFGKCLGMGALGLTQFAMIFVFAAACYKLLIPADYLLGGMPITLDAFTVRTALLIVVFFILGYALYAMMNAVCGASVSKIEDLNSAMMPVMMVSMASFYAAYFSMLVASADSIIQKVVLYLPFTSPFIMPYKLLNSDVATTDIIISIILLLALIVIISAVCVRLYSASVLHYGKRLKFKELYRKQ